MDVIAFLSDPVYLKILEATMALFAAMAVSWIVYVHLSKRDLFDLAKPGKKGVGGWAKAVYVLKYLFVFPLLTFFWFILFVLCLRLISDASAESIMFLGIILVSAVRVAAYASERMAEDLAKMIPIAVLTTVFLDPTFQSLNLDLEGFRALTTEGVRFAKYLLFIIVLEFGLKIAGYVYSKVQVKTVSAS